MPIDPVAQTMVAGFLGGIVILLAIAFLVGLVKALHKSEPKPPTIYDWKKQNIFRS